MQGRAWWQILLALFLILSGLLVITNLTIAGAPVIMAVLAIIAGIALLFGK